MQSVHVNITEKQQVGFKTDFLVDIARRAVELSRPDLTSENELTISLVFVDDSEIQRLNREYRKKDQPTDVLSFSYLDNADAGDGLEAGEIIISVDTMKKQAQEYAHSELKETELLFTHGLLHVFGYDHENERDRKAMIKMERKIIGDKSGVIDRAVVE